MYCMKCGKPLPDGARFCPDCGAKNDSTNSGPSQDAHHSGGGSFDGFFSFNRAANYGYHLINRLLTPDIITACLAVILLVLAAVVPIISIDFLWMKPSYSLSRALNLFTGGGGLKGIFLVAYVVFVMMFFAFKFIGNTRKLSAIGCIGSWVLLVFFYILARSADSGTVYLGFGSYIWAFGGILEIVSLYLDPRKRADSFKS